MNPYRVLAVGIVANIGIAAIKIITGILYSSLALISDGIHSISDILGTSIGYIGVRISSKPPDKTHPFGHSRFEPLFAFIIGVILILTAYEIGREALKRISSAEFIQVNEIMLGVVIFSIVSKEALTQYTLRAGKRLNNQILIADAYHHRSDVLSSIAVLAGLLFQKFGFIYGDSLAGIAVAAMIAKAAFEIMEKNIHYLTGMCPAEETLEKIKDAAESVDGVEGIHDLRAHYVGKDLQVDIHIEVSEDKTLKEAHDIGTEVKKRLREIEEVGEAFVHIDISGENDGKI
ncbi:cation diffusion facilitator family transporter [Geoglobus acetivorans]|uniref:Cobalt-zinc-cadmium resistance protein n=1 Tax=Geoglobus acetivorans TaxID=565033 RepID=A0A0A7GFI3_GEOAI|nr:Cobalt-zinc-cadmium resistance protein [Geoglobus acetivorans]